MPRLHFRVYPPNGIELGDIQFKGLDQTAYAKLYRDFKRDMLAAQKKDGERSFQCGVESNISDKPVALQFVWKSDTAAIVIWARPTGAGNVPDLQGVSLFLTRLDPAAELAMLEKVAANPHMTAISREGLAAAKDDPYPLAVTFFATEDGARDSLIRALITMSAAAFFDQFGMADPNHVVKMEFKGIVALPEGSPLVEPKELVVSKENEQALFRNFNEAIKRGNGFLMTLSLQDEDEFPITIRYTQLCPTSAFFMLTHDVGDDVKHIHGLTALLAKLDRDEDRKVIETVRQFAAIRGVSQDAFDESLRVDYPVAATFYADHGSAGYAPLNTVIRILSAAFFSQYGIGTDGPDL